MGKTKTEKPREYVASIKTELLKTGLQFKADKLEKNGALSANDLNAFTNIMKGALYAEQVELQRVGINRPEQAVVGITLSKADRKRLDEIAKLLAPEEE